jgi:hypothetical protein
MIWAGICHDGRTQLTIVQGTMNAVKYRDDIRDPIVLPFLQQRNFERVFQHGNARCHVALSPDLSPIEYICEPYPPLFH